MVIDRQDFWGPTSVDGIMREARLNACVHIKPRSNACKSGQHVALESMYCVQRRTTTNDHASFSEHNNNFSGPVRVESSALPPPVCVCSAPSICGNEHRKSILSPDAYQTVDW